MRELIRKIIKEESVPPRGFKFSEGGYLIPCDLKEATVMLHDVEYRKLEGLNESAKDLYEAKKEYLDTLVLHNKGVLQKAIEKYRTK